MKTIEIKDRGVWDNFLSTSESDHFLQSWQWGVFESDGLGKNIFRLGFENERGDLEGVCLAVEEISRFGKFIYCPRGPVINWEDSVIRESILDSMKKYFEDKGYFCLRVDPAVLKDSEHIASTFGGLGFRDSVYFVQVERCWMLDLEGKSEEELMLGMRKKSRYALKKAMESDVEIGMSDSIEDFEVFLDLLEMMSLKKKFPAIPRKYLLKQFELLGDFIKFFYAKQDGEIIAGGLFSFYGDESTYLRGASIDSVSSSNASYVLQWEAIEYAKSLGIKRHNFMGVAEEKDYHPGYPAFGYSNFKRGFGGYVEEYIRTKDFVYNVIKYKLLRLNQWYRKVKYKGCN